MKAYLILACIAAAAAGLLFGFDTSVISGAIEFIASDKVFGLGAIEKGWTVSCIIVGAMIGCVFTGPLGDRFGRKKLLIFTSLFFFISSLGCAISETYISFILYRILAGVAVGAASMLAPMYIAEIAPAKHRGKLVALNLFAIFLGQFLAFFSNFLLREQGGVDNWRWMIGIQIIPSAILFVILFFIPESPRWLIDQKKMPEALRVLTKINDAETATREAAEIEDSIKETKSSKFGEILKGKPFRLLLIGSAVGVFQQVTGINVIMYYAPSIFSSAGFGTASSLFQTAIMGFVNLTFAVVSMLLIDRLGRKPLMVVGSAGMGIALLLLAITFITNSFPPYFVLICIMFFLAFFGFSLGPVVWVLIVEIFPNRLRSYATGVSVFLVWASNFIVSFTFPYLLVNLKGYTFLIYSFMCLLCFIFSIRVLTETKGKSLEQIEAELT